MTSTLEMAKRHDGVWVWPLAEQPEPDISEFYRLMAEIEKATMAPNVFEGLASENKHVTSSRDS